MVSGSYANNMLLLLFLVNVDHFLYSYEDINIQLFFFLGLIFTVTIDLRTNSLEQKKICWIPYKNIHVIDGCAMISTLEIAQDRKEEIVLH